MKYKSLWEYYKLTVPSATWWTVHGISTIEPTCAVMLVKFTVLKDVSSTSGADVAFNWFTLLELLLLLLLTWLALRNLLPSLRLLLLNLFDNLFVIILLESLIEFGTVKLLLLLLLLDAPINLSLSNVRVWFCSIRFGIIKKPIEEALIESKLRQTKVMVDGEEGKSIITLMVRREKNKNDWLGFFVLCCCCCCCWTLKSVFASLHGYTKKN